MFFNFYQGLGLSKIVFLLLFCDASYALKTIKWVDLESSHFKSKKRFLKSTFHFYLTFRAQKSALNAILFQKISILSNFEAGPIDTFQQAF